MFVLEDRGLFGETRLDAGNVVHAQASGDGGDGNERNPDESGVLHPDLSRRAPIRMALRTTAQHQQRPAVNRDRRDQLRQAHAQIADTAFNPNAVPCKRRG